MEPKKTKVAILGGGAGALAAAWALTATPERRAAHEVTVYQVGFRLGGKARSGRNPEAGHRIEEQGLHVWLGFYENAFRLLRGCYEELGRPAETPLATWQHAFQKRNRAVVFCKLSGEGAPDDGWFPWSFTFPENHRLPGDGGELPSTWTLFRLATEWLWSSWRSSEAAATLRARTAGEPRAGVTIPPWIARTLRRIEVRGAFAPLHHPLVGVAFPVHDLAEIVWTSPLDRLISAIRNVVRALPEDPAAHDAASHHILTWLLRKLNDVGWPLLAPYVQAEPWAYKLWVALNLASATAIGMLSDGVLFHGWSSIDHVDWATWLQGHGANDVTLSSGPVKAVYDMVHAFVNGEADKGNLAAGTCLSGLLRMFLTYKGALFWDPAAGTGDTVFAPLYEVLQRRGVKFKFFHKVAALYLSPDSKRVASIELVEQVRLKSGEYDPLVTVRGLPCWPNAPRHEQIEDGEELLAAGVDLESPYSPPWKGARPVLLNVGDDFDSVVLGIPIGAVPYVAPELIHADRRFASMVANVGTVQTMSFQLWMGLDAERLGWPPPRDEEPERTVMTAFIHPVNTWADMSHLLWREDWQSPTFPKSVSYFCGPLSQLGPNPPFMDHGFPARQRARVQSIARRFLENDVGRVWPLATKSGGYGFRWEHVVSQHHHAGINPSDRYVLSVAGSAQHRLPAGQSGFENLVLAGDWVRTSLNAGCIEAAVEAGLYAAEALLGEPLDVFGRELVEGS